MINNIQKFKAKTGLIWSLLFGWALAIGLLWPGEEPSKINTLIVIGIVFSLAYTIITLAYRSKIIKSKIYWMVVFMIMMTLVVIVLQFILTGSDIGHREIEGFDPVRYDYEAKIAVENNWDFTAAKGSYNFLGVIYYIAGIYWLFGVSTLYVSLFNLLFVLTGFLAVTKILVDQTNEIQPWQKMAWGMLIPSVIYYAALTSKDILTMSLIAIILCLVNRLLNKKKLLLLLYLAICSGALIMIRASALIIVIIVTAYIILFMRKNKKFVIYALFILIILSIIALQLAPIITEQLGGTPFRISTLLALEPKIKMAEELSTKGSLNLLFTPKTYIQVVLFMPIRALFLLIAPFPNIWILGSSSKIKFDVLSLWLILLYLPALFAATISRKIRKLDIYKFIVIPFWLMLITIATALFIIHERYRLMFMPLWFAAILLAFHYDNPRKYIFLSLAFIVSGAIFYALLKLVA